MNTSKKQIDKPTVTPLLSFQDLKISKKDVKQCVLTNHAKAFEDGWKIFKIYNDKHIFAVKIRKKYDKDEINFNEDGYKYDQIFLNVLNTRDYLFLKSKGYNVDGML